MKSTLATIDRARGIGGSDAPTVAGVDPYRQPLELALIKRGELEEEDVSEKPAVVMGRTMEPAIASAWEQRTGKKLRAVNLTQHHPEHEQIWGHVDRLITGERAGLEVKNRSARMAHYYGPEGSDQVMETDIVQCHHYLLLRPRWERMEMAVYLGGDDLRCYTIPRDQSLCDWLLETELAFWEAVEGRRPLPEIAIDHTSTPRLLTKLYPGTTGEVVTLGDSEAHWHHVREEAGRLAKEYGETADVARRHLLRALGEAAVGVLPGIGEYTRKRVERKGYEVSATSYIDFRFKKQRAC